jgi:leucyl aminopeptidase (aminopeptidase T)
MKDGAAVLVGTCAGVRPSERVIIVTDEERLGIAEAVRDEATAAGGSARVVVSPPRSIDNEEPIEVVSAAMAEADVIFLVVTHSLAHTRATREAIAAGARVVSMSAFTERQMREGGLFADFRARKPLCDHLAAALTESEEVRVTNPAGSDLTFSVSGRAGNSHACIVEGPGFTAVPNIEANTSPLEGTTQGRLVVDGSIPYYGVGVIQEPVVFDIADGVVRSIVGGDQATFLRDLLARQDDPAVYNVAQFAIGLNPLCTEFNGEMLNDEGVNGTIHMGIGTSANLGGQVQAKTHFDAIITRPSVWFDGRAIIRDGELLTGP